MSERHFISRRRFIKYSTLGAAGLVGASSSLVATNLALAAVNPISAENSLPGDPTWVLTNSGDDTTRQIKGYASATSVNKGGSINFHVSVNPAQTFDIKIFRIGWYNGVGGRLMQTITGVNATNQTVPAPDSFGMVACTWPVSYTLNVPNTWVSGVYLAKLINANGGYENYIHFVVRDDARTADLMVQCSVTTYHAYDGFGGKSLYPANSSSNIPAQKVSLDRPYSGQGFGQFYYYEMPMVRFLERQGYDVVYCTNVDLHAAAPSFMNTRKGFVSMGHDEYYSKPMYDNLTAYRNAGKHLAFMGANEIYWQIRFESNASSIANRVIVGYKDTFMSDPQYPGPLTTYLWRELPSGNSRPENALVGVMYDSYSDSTTGQPYRVKNSSHWVYTGTGFTDNQMIPYIVGYEWDKRFANGVEPAGLVELSNSDLTDHLGAPGSSNSTIYQAATPSTAWVFASGSIFWSYGLDYAGYQLVDATNPGLQRATRNVLDRFIGTASPNITTFRPLESSKTVGNLLLTLDGINFASGAVVKVNNGTQTTALTTTFVNSTKVTAQLPYSQISTPGKYTVTVTNPDGRSSLEQCFTHWRVNLGSDAGETTDGATMGKLSYALKNSASPDLISFAGIGSPPTITVSGQLPTVKPGVMLYGGECTDPNVVINGSGTGADGLVLMGNTRLKNIEVKGFTGRQITNIKDGVAQPGNNELTCTVAKRN